MDDGRRALGPIARWNSVCSPFPLFSPQVLFTFSKRVGMGSLETSRSSDPAILLTVVSSGTPSCSREKPYRFCREYASTDVA